MGGAISKEKGNEKRFRIRQFKFQRYITRKEWLVNLTLAEHLEGKRDGSKQ